jgi:hypothetical protein
MKDKNKVLTITCYVLIAAIAVTLLWGLVKGKHVFKDNYDDGIEQIDLDTIYLNGSKVEVDFSEVIIGTQEEMRKLIVSTQEATVSTELTSELIRQLDFNFLKKTQKVSYTGKGYFVVDLDNLTKSNILQDKQKKTITIKIDHAYLEAIEINPEKIIIDEVKEGLLARGDIKLTVKDYNAIEKELRNRMEEKFNTAENGQNADKIALQMVKEVYEPVIKAIDSSYELNVEFQ